jgi:hypothetical protein
MYLNVTALKRTVTINEIYKFKGTVSLKILLLLFCFICIVF